MKKNYLKPAIKTMSVSTENVMGLTATSGIYEQGVGGNGSDKEARTQEISLF